MSTETPPPDPFEELRDLKWPDSGYKSSRKPYDTLDEEQREAFGQDLLDLCATYVSDAPASGSLSKKDRDKWSNILVSIIAQDQDFIRLVVDECDTPGTHQFTHLRCREDWLIGIYLPGFYSHHKSFSAGYKQHLLPLLRDVNRDIIGKAKATVERALDQINIHRLDTFNEDDHSEKKPSTYATEPCIAQMYILCQQDKSVNFQRLITFEHMQDLDDMINKKYTVLPTCTKLFSRYQSSTEQDDSLIDQFGKAVQNVLPQWARTASDLKILSLDEDFQVQMESAMNDAEVTDGGQDDEYEESDTKFTPASGKVEGINPNANAYDEPFGLQELSEALKEHFKMIPTFLYPNFVAPKAGKFFFDKPLAASLSQFDSQEGEARTTSGGQPLYRSQGFKRARMKSHREMMDIVEAEATPDREQVMSDCLTYLAMVSNNDWFNKQAFDSQYQTLSTMVVRPKAAVTAQKGDTIFRGFSDLILRDNWYHVRCLFHAVDLLMQKRTSASKKAAVTKKLADAEKNLTILVSMVGAGANDPLPFVLAVEAAVRSLWRQIKASTPAKTPHKLRLLFSELAVWINGTVVNAYVIRCPVRIGMKADTIVQDWYPAIYEYNSECANPDCARLLPHPDQVDSQWLRGTFSVGVRDVRNGRKAIRQFISTNRDNVYDCLFYVLRFFKPQTRTIVFMFWFAHLFHSSRCKFARGKPASYHSDPD